MDPTPPPSLPITNPNNPNSNYSFLHYNGFNSDSSKQIEISNIEMTAFQSVSYTSLRDILPSSPATITSPTNNSSWYEIPIKNPLVKQAALAYLQPMSTPPETAGKGIWGRLKEVRCDCDDGCFWWLRDAVVRFVRALLGGEKGVRLVEYDDEEDDDEEDEDYMKVD